MTTGVCGKRVLAPGYRFEPYDQELLKFYLLPKVNGSFVYARIFHDIDLYCCHPSLLPSALEEGGKYSYFFTSRVRKFDKGLRSDRCIKDGKGYWRMTSGINEVHDAGADGSILGRKNTLVYYEKTKEVKGVGRKTNWIMHEFVLDDNFLHHSDDKKANAGVVVCRIYDHDHRPDYKRKRKTVKDQEDKVITKQHSTCSREESHSTDATSVIDQPAVYDNSGDDFDWSCFPSEEEILSMQETLIHECGIVDQPAASSTGDEIVPTAQPAVYDNSGDDFDWSCFPSEEEILSMQETLIHECGIVDQPAASSTGDEIVPTAQPAVYDNSGDVPDWSCFPSEEEILSMQETLIHECGIVDQPATSSTRDKITPTAQPVVYDNSGYIFNWSCFPSEEEILSIKKTLILLCGNM